MCEECNKVATNTSSSLYFYTQLFCERFVIFVQLAALFITIRSIITFVCNHGNTGGAFQDRVLEILFCFQKGQHKL